MILLKSMNNKKEIVYSILLNCVVVITPPRDAVCREGKNQKQQQKSGNKQTKKQPNRPKHNKLVSVRGCQTKLHNAGLELARVLIKVSAKSMQKASENRLEVN